MSLNDLIRNDIDQVFMNLSDFAEECFIEGQSVVAVFYNDDVKVPNLSSGSQELGIVNKIWTLQARESDLPGRSPGDLIEINNRYYIVQSWMKELGVIVASLTENQ